MITLVCSFAVAQASVLDGIQALINRVLTRAERNFTFNPVLELIDPHINEYGQSVDQFEIFGDRTKKTVIFRGSSGAALGAAFGKYLRYYLHCDIHWEMSGGYSFNNFPAKLEDMVIPDISDKTIFLSKLRYYKNTCTESYSFAWTNWESFEEEIDWMAINGFNMPLAFTGQEYVWRELFRSFGVQEDALSAYFSGPAFLAWNRMSNLKAWGGPLPSTWIDQQFFMQKKLLQRYQDLGIEFPVLPAFNGVVPSSFVSLFPNSTISQLGSWCNFPSDYCCPYIVAGNDPLFQSIGSAFIRLQRELYGESVSNVHTYNCDTFNENKPSSNDPAYLKAISAAVYQSIIQADSQATWVMQGWLFVSDPSFWTPNVITSFLSGVPDSNMIILDLTSDAEPMWPTLVSNNKPFIWCMLHNYGGMRSLNGNFTTLKLAPKEAFSAAKGLMLGTGLTMEAINTNPIIYEYFAEMSTHGNTPIPDEYRWSELYAIRRYGIKPCQYDDQIHINHHNNTICDKIEQEKNAHAKSVIRALVQNNYHGPILTPGPRLQRALITIKPTFELQMLIVGSAEKLTNIWQEMQSIGQHHVAAYNYDLVDVVRQVLSNLHFDLYNNWQAAFQRRDLVSLKLHSQQMIELMNDFDMILSTSYGYLLGTWLTDARSWSTDETLQDLYEFNARNQITLWGPHSVGAAAGTYGGLQDYAAKAWAGLTKDYYLKRWQLFIKFAEEALTKGKNTVDMAVYGQAELDLSIAWTKETLKTKSFNTEPVGSSWAISQSLLLKYGNLYRSRNSYNTFPDVDNPGYTLNYNNTAAETRNIAQLQYLCDIEPKCMGFTTEGYFKSFVSSSVQVPAKGVTVYMKSSSEDN